MAKNLLATPTSGPITNILDSVVTQVYKQKDENIVANLSLFNPHNSNKVIDADINVPLEKPLLPKCSDYKLTIARFRVPLNSLYPGFTCKGLFFETVFKFNNNFYSTSFVVNVDFFSILDFVAFVNNMLRLTHQQMPGFNPNVYPYLFYDDETRLFNLVYPTNYYGGTGPQVLMIFSNDLYYFVAGLPAKPSPDKPGYFELNLNSSPYHLFFSDILDLNGTPIVVSTSGFTRYNSYILTAEYSTSYRFNDIQSVIVTTNIPIRQEQLPLNSANLFTSGPNSVAYISTLAVLSDFSVSITQFGQQFENLIYYPQSQFRWTDMISDSQLDRLSFGFFVQKEDQSIQKIKLNPGDSCSIKIYFVSKNKFYAYKGYD
jgi:hypothetical protein